MPCLSLKLSIWHSFGVFFLSVFMVLCFLACWNRFFRWHLCDPSRQKGLFASQFPYSSSHICHSHSHISTIFSPLLAFELLSASLFPEAPQDGECLIGSIELKVGWCCICAHVRAHEPGRPHTPISPARVWNAIQKKGQVLVLTLVYSNLEVVGVLKECGFAKAENKYKASLHPCNFGVRMNWKHSCHGWTESSRVSTTRHLTVSSLWLLKSLY